MYKKGYSINDIIDKLDISISTIYKWFRENNVELFGNREQQPNRYDVYLDQVQDMIEKRYSQRDMAKELGVDRNVIRFLLKRHNLKTDPEIYKSEDEIRRMVKEYNPDFEYLGGYSGWQSKVTIRCNSCKSVFKKGSIQFQKKKAVCKRCLEIESKHGKQCDYITKTIKKKKMDRVIERNKLIRCFTDQLRNLHKCPTCDKLTIGKVYCSDKCKKRMNNRKKEMKRRHKIIVDKDITLEKLCKRDNGICYLCNKPVDWNDFKYEIRSGVKTFIQGNNYPNIEHVKPQAKGGVDSWENVKLAHMYCNAIKNDKIIGDGTPLWS